MKNKDSRTKAMTWRMIIYKWSNRILYLIGDRKLIDEMNAKIK
jgi:hypothetical protein